jgi:hypothetical protein
MWCTFESPVQQNKFKRHSLQVYPSRARGVQLRGYNWTDTARYRMSSEGHLLSFCKTFDVVCVCVCVCVCVEKDVICPSWHTKLYSAQWLLRVTTEFCILPRDVINLLVTNVANVPNIWTVSLKWLVFIKQDCVLCDSGSAYLRIIQTNLRVHQRLRVTVDATIRQPITTKSQVKSRDLLLAKLPPDLSHPLSAPNQKWATLKSLCRAQWHRAV